VASIQIGVATSMGATSQSRRRFAARMRKFMGDVCLQVMTT
jgi:hypothetical protein